MARRPGVRSALRRSRWRLRQVLQHRLRFGDRGATALEFCLLLAVIVLPSYAIIRMSLIVLSEHYRLIVTLNALPLP